MSDPLRSIIARNRGGEAVAIPSVCSAHPDVIKASLLRAETLNRAIVIEATSNQVNQDGGYTGMRARNFVEFVHGLARECSVDQDRIIFGGDHLGPQVWRKQDAKAAMAKAHVLVDQYVRAGFMKIHLDCSEGCDAEPAQLDDQQTADRSAKLAQTCLHAAQGDDRLMFVVGTEVPPPGGARADESEEIKATTPAAAKVTLAAHRAAFGDMTTLIGGLVVQPGVEFTPMGVHRLPMNRDPSLLAALAEYPGVCLEAHSTDYQSTTVFPRLAALGFAFQKVGPALTFAYRQAVYSLDTARRLAGRGTGNLPAVMEQLMTEQPRYWRSHYHGNSADQKLQRHFGLADRIRYYWPQPSAQSAVAELQADLEQTLPDPVLWQVFAPEVLDRAEALAGTQFQRILLAQIQIALDPYFFGDSVKGAL